MNFDMHIGYVCMIFGEIFARRMIQWQLCNSNVVVSVTTSDI
jgi:hypothetical protein